MHTNSWKELGGAGTSTREAETGSSLNSRQTWSTKHVPGQSGTSRNPVSKRAKTQTNKNSWKEILHMPFFLDTG